MQNELSYPRIEQRIDCSNDLCWVFSLLSSLVASKWSWNIRLSFLLYADIIKFFRGICSAKECAKLQQHTHSIKIHGPDTDFLDVYHRLFLVNYFQYAPSVWNGVDKTSSLNIVQTRNFFLFCGITICVMMCRNLALPKKFEDGRLIFNFFRFARHVLRELVHLFFRNSSPVVFLRLLSSCCRSCCTLCMVRKEMYSLSESVSCSCCVVLFLP